MTVLNENGVPMRFYGRIRSTNEQVVFVSLEVSDKPNYVKAILFKHIPANLQEEFKSIINSHECQTLKTKPLYEYLQTKMFSTIQDKNVYAALIGMSVVRDLPKNEVLVECPNDEYRTVDEIIDYINQAKSMKLLEKEKDFGDVQSAMSQRETLMANRLNEQDNKIEDLRSKLSSVTDILTKLNGTLQGINDKFVGLESRLEEVRLNQKAHSDLSFAPNVPSVTEQPTEDWQEGLPPLVG